MEGDKKGPQTGRHSETDTRHKPLAKSGLGGSVWGRRELLQGHFQHPRPGGCEAHGQDIFRNPVRSPVLRSMVFPKDKNRTKKTHKFLILSL